MLKIFLSEHFSFFFDALCVCRLLSKAVKKKATYYYKEVISSMIMEGLFLSNIFACVALRFVCNLLFKANEKNAILL